MSKVIYHITPVNILEEELLWKKIGGVPLFMKGLLGLEPDSDAIVITTKTEVYAYLLDDGYEVYLMSDFQMSTEERFDIASFTELISFVIEGIDKSFFSEFSPVIFYDYRNVCIKQNMISNILNYYHESNTKLLITASAPEDHPIQYDEYFQLPSYEYLMCLEQANLSDVLNDHQKKANLNLLERQGYSLITTPYYFDWVSNGVLIDTSSSGFYVKSDLLNHEGYIPFEEYLHLIGEHISENDTILYFENKNCARRVLPKLIKDIFGTSNLYLPALNDLNLSIVYNKDQNSLYLKRDSFQQELRVKSYLVSDHFSALFGGQIHYTDKDQDDSVENLYVRINGIIDDLDLLNGMNSILLAFQSMNDDQPFYFSEPANFENMNWSIDGDIEKVVINDTMKVLTGRQDFPAILKIDLSIIVIEPNLINNFTRMIDRVDFELFELSENDLVRVLNDVDIIRYNHICKD